MWRLGLTNRSASERGAVAVIVAVFFSGMVVFAALALTVDVGNAMVGRRAIQNGADAAAMALAQECAKGDSECISEPTATLNDLAGANASVGYSADNATEISEICGHGVAGFEECTEGAYSRLTACLPASENVKEAHYVEVRTRTQTTDGDSVLPKVFSQMLTGGGSDLTVEACARGAWGAPASTGKTLPLTIGLCDWMNRTGSGTRYAPAPPYLRGPAAVPAEFPGVEPPDEVSGHIEAIFSHDNSGHKCSGPPGQEYPGGFGWLDPGSDCSAVILDDHTVPGDTGNHAPDTCKLRLKGYLGTEVLVPVFDSVTGTGRNARFHISGVASFYLAGFANIPSAQPNKNSSVYTRPTGLCANCTGSNNVFVWGWFTSGLKSVDASAIGSGPDRGVTIIAPAG